MENVMRQVEEDIEKIALRVVTLEKDDIPALGELLNLISALEEIAQEIDASLFLDLILALKCYAEKLVLFEESDLSALEDGITALQDMWRALDNNEKFNKDITDILGRLGFQQKENIGVENSSEQIAQETEKESIKNGTTGKGAEKQNINEEDIEIIGDFIIESMENLDSIEVHLMELENNPSEEETINAIFRPFHTIKGVSGFLNLKKINRLSHSTENLLDSVRQGIFKINDEIVDLILESVDFLKKIIGNLEKNLKEGNADLEGQIDVEPLIKKIQQTDTDASVKESSPLGEMLVDMGAAEKEDIKRSLEIQKKSPEKKIGQILVDEKIVKPKEIISALQKQKKGKRVADLNVKVDTEKLDNLINLTGELVISQAMLRQNRLILSSKDQQLDQNLNRLTQIVSGLQQTAMSMRMVPIKSTFQKMVRLVRDLSRNSGKEAGLEMKGEDTEIDRNVVEELYEPMVHMIRNAVDHGLESPEEREKAGKNRKGIIWLRSYHKGGNIVIELEDDGRGLNKEKIIEKAIASNLIGKDTKLTEPEIYDLIFQPGFSTAKEITDVSGRGVGMDVVRKRIEKLRGRLDIRSVLGRGSTFIISLPLTLAIIEGMVVRVGEERYIVPTMTIVESFKPSRDDYFTVKEKGEMIKVRGKLIPMIRLGRIFEIKEDSTDPSDGLVVVVENKKEQRGLLLDELLGQEEIVIKSLGEFLKNIKGLAGAAILGDGRVGLILDIAGLFEISIMH